LPSHCRPSRRRCHRGQSQIPDDLTEARRDRRSGYFAFPANCNAEPRRRCDAEWHGAPLPDRRRQRLVSRGRHRPAPTPGRGRGRHRVERRRGGRTSAGATIPLREAAGITGSIHRGPPAALLLQFLVAPMRVLPARASRESVRRLVSGPGPAWRQATVPNDGRTAGLDHEDGIREKSPRGKITATNRKRSGVS
jgi:hypothetical protein